MIPGTIEEWKKALKESEPGVQRAICVMALFELGQRLERSDGDGWYEIGNSQWVAYMSEYRVKPTARPWNAEDAKRHVGFAYRTSGGRIGIIGVLPDGSPASGMQQDYWRHWSQDFYARPLPGTDPATWDWQKCEVVE